MAPTLALRRLRLRNGHVARLRHVRRAEAGPPPAEPLGVARAVDRESRSWRPPREAAAVAAPPAPRRPRRSMRFELAADDGRSAHARRRGTRAQQTLGRAAAKYASRRRAPAPSPAPPPRRPRRARAERARPARGARRRRLPVVGRPRPRERDLWRRAAADAASAVNVGDARRGRARVLLPTGAGKSRLAAGRRSRRRASPSSWRRTSRSRRPGRRAGAVRVRYSHFSSTLAPPRPPRSCALRPCASPRPSCTRRPSGSSTTSASVPPSTCSTRAGSSRESSSTRCARHVRAARAARDPTSDIATDLRRSRRAPLFIASQAHCVVSWGRDRRPRLPLAGLCDLRSVHGRAAHECCSRRRAGGVDLRPLPALDPTARASVGSRAISTGRRCTTSRCRSRTSPLDNARAVAQILNVLRAAADADAETQRRRLRARARRRRRRRQRRRCRRDGRRQRRRRRRRRRRRLGHRGRRPLQHEAEKVAAALGRARDSWPRFGATRRWSRRCARRSAPLAARRDASNRRHLGLWHRAPPSRPTSASSALDAAGSLVSSSRRSGGAPAGDGEAARCVRCTRRTTRAASRRCSAARVDDLRRLASG